MTTPYRFMSSLLLACACASAGRAHEKAGPARIDLSLSVHAGPAEGFLQTPTGGQPGTSDIKRPTLEELDIDDVLFYDLAVSVPWREMRFYLGGQFITMSGDGVLEDDLITRRPFPAGTPYDAEVSFDWYRLGGALAFELDHDITLQPLVELVLLDFHYALDTPADEVRRGYAKPALRIGVEALLPWRERFDAKVAAATSVPVSDAPVIATAEALLRYRLHEGTPLATAHIFAGLGLLYIDYEDSQTLPNHIRLEATPYFTLGFAAALGGGGS